MSNTHTSPLAAERLLSDLQSRIGLVGRRLVEIREIQSPRKGPEVDGSERLAQVEADLVADQRHLEFLVAGVQQTLKERSAQGWAADLPKLRPKDLPRPPLFWRAARVIYRRSRDQIADTAGALWAARHPPPLPRVTNPAAAPTFSVVIPTRDRCSNLLQTLSAYEAQISNLNFEVLVVDDGSQDDTFEALSKLKPVRYTLKALRQKGSGPAAARNLALQYAEGPWILFTGDDIEPEPDLLLRHWQAHQTRDEAPEIAILGLIRWPLGVEQTATMRHIDGPGAQQFNFTWMKAGREYDFRHFYTSNLSVSRALLDRCDGFSTEFSDAAYEDAELAHRLSLQGLRIAYVPEAVTYHHHPYDADGFFARQQRCGRMARVLQRLHPELARWTGQQELEQKRADLLRLGSESQSKLSSIADQLPAWHQRCSIIASHLDAHDPPGTDDFLEALFHLAAFSGLTESQSCLSSSVWVASLLVESLPVPARRLLPMLDGTAKAAAADLATLPRI